MDPTAIMAPQELLPNNSNHRDMFMVQTVIMVQPPNSKLMSTDLIATMVLHLNNSNLTFMGLIATMDLPPNSKLMFMDQTATMDLLHNNKKLTYMVLIAIMAHKVINRHNNKFMCMDLNVQTNAQLLKNNLNKNKNNNQLPKNPRKNYDFILNY